MKASIVLGAGFGDEGKGNFVNHLTKHDPKHSIVVRFNGGHQAGHTVIHGDKRHVFSSFGSGTLNNVPTYWSKYCTVYPIGFNREYNALVKLGIDPVIYIDPMCPITTPFDIICNKESEQINGHGSCGLGFGKTVWRHETLDHSYRIFAKDLNNPWILRQKLVTLMRFYGYDRIDLIDDFINHCNMMLERVSFAYPAILFNYDHLIFEGAQGILLDREHGIFPHVTRSHTNSKNAIEILDYLNVEDIDVYYMTRCYSTRHGNGPFFEDVINPNNPDETNVYNEHQGSFKIAPFYYKNLQYSIDTDRIYNINHVLRSNRTIVVTCMDQLDQYPVYRDDLGGYDSLDRSDFKELFPNNTIFVDKPNY